MWPLFQGSASRPRLQSGLKISPLKYRHHHLQSAFPDREQSHPILLSGIDAYQLTIQKFKMGASTSKAAKKASQLSATNTARKYPTRSPPLSSNRPHVQPQTQTRTANIGPNVHPPPKIAETRDHGARNTSRLIPPDDGFTSFQTSDVSAALTALTSTSNKLRRSRSKHRHKSRPQFTPPIPRSRTTKPNLLQFLNLQHTRSSP